MRRARERGGAKRRFVQPRPAIGEAAAVTADHFDIGQQMMAEGDRLRRLQMGETRHDRGRILLGTVDERGLQVAQHELEPVDRIAYPQPHIERDLVVARTRGMQPSAGRSDQFGQPRFDIEMDVLEPGRELEPCALDLLANLQQPAPDGAAVLGRDDALRHQHIGMRQRARDVLRIEPAVETDGSVDPLHDFRRSELVTAAPHRVGAALARSRSRVLSCHEFVPSIL